MERFFNCFSTLPVLALSLGAPSTEHQFRNPPESSYWWDWFGFMFFRDCTGFSRSFVRHANYWTRTFAINQIIWILFILTLREFNTWLNFCPFHLRCWVWFWLAFTGIKTATFFQSEFLLNLRLYINYGCSIIGWTSRSTDGRPRHAPVGKSLW